MFLHGIDAIAFWGTVFKIFRICSLYVQYCNLNRLAHEVGWKYQKVVGTLEARRKVKSKQFFERKRKLQVGYATLDCCVNK